ncbi:hypothetical protein BH18ACT11_BH18ACT11_14480 [soil metagenome]
MRDGALRRVVAVHPVPQPVADSCVPNCSQPSEEQNVKTLLRRALILAAPIVLRKIRNRRRER